jgi:hypothetical protein
MKKHLDLSTESLRRNMILTRAQSASIPEDSRINPADRFGLEQQNVADYLTLSGKCAKAEKSIEKIRTDYAGAMLNVINPEDVGKLRDISDSSNSMPVSATAGSLPHRSLSREIEILKRNRKHDCFTLLKKNGVSPEEVARIRKNHSSRINRVMEPFMAGGYGGSPSPQPRDSGGTRGTGHVWHSLYYKRSFFTEILRDGKVSPLQMSLPDQGCVWNYLVIKNHDPGDFDASAGILQNEIGEVLWLNKGSRITVEFDMTCLFADAYLKGEDEFGFSGYDIKLKSFACASVGSETKQDALWSCRDHQGPGITIFDMNYTIEGYPKNGTKSFAFTFGPVPETKYYIVWVGLRDTYYCFQNDYEIDLIFDNMWTINEVRVTELV